MGKNNFGLFPFVEKEAPLILSLSKDSGWQFVKTLLPRRLFLRSVSERSGMLQ